MEGDKAILDAATEAIKELNVKYSSKYGDKFYLLHRERLWNESENGLDGLGTKTRQIEEFNRLICEPSKKTSHSTVTGDFRKSIKLQPVQFIITLDSDTKLPPDSAKNLVRTIAHPLNRARYDQDKKRITRDMVLCNPVFPYRLNRHVKHCFPGFFQEMSGLIPIRPLFRISIRIWPVKRYSPEKEFMI
jgi:cyclic beta-1,2-glucan synthetase